MTRQASRQRAAHHRPGAAAARMRRYQVGRYFGARDRVEWEDVTTLGDQLRGVRVFKASGCWIENPKPGPGPVIPIGAIPPGGTTQDIFAAHERDELSRDEAADVIERLRPEPWWRRLWPW